CTSLIVVIENRESLDVW
nr:immunoglobulin heavy chain junction region [Macaca mulatta]MOW98748.1 immunoglobulin heavy chain junction region [Macaca mulatta]MOW99513.1 immunoglobulin heavy chain junction region [Macaca mulatta]MOX02672.1 immunoglobulin heavy chain junction region [Macaca mulatta]MOX02711.1 immunoglobulin heavy chain junction region [Macaca mulatta]